MPEREDEIGSLWERTSQSGNEFMSGKINGEDVVIFKSNSTNPKAPQWRVYKSRPRPEGPTTQRSRRYEGHGEPPF